MLQLIYWSFFPKVDVSFAVLLAMAFGFQANVWAIYYSEDFSRGLDGWIASEGSWEIKAKDNGTQVLSAHSSGDVFAWKTNVVIDSSWAFRTYVSFEKCLGDAGTVGAASLAMSEGLGRRIWILATVNHYVTGAANITLQYWDSQWHSLVPDSGWQQGALPNYQLDLRRLPGSNQIRFSVSCTNGFSYNIESSPLPEDILNTLDTPGLRCLWSALNYSNIHIETPAGLSTESRQHHITMANNAVADLLSHFWIGDETQGHIANTWHGYTDSLQDARGVLWERATLFNVLHNLHLLTGSMSLKQRLYADWNRTKALYRPDELEACGNESGTNWACDDAGWSALMYLAAYETTRDPDALARALGLVKNAYGRWHDEQLGGGLWYNDSRTLKSLYQAALALAALRVYEHTGIDYFFEKAQRSYTWIERKLLRVDGLYWCDYGTTGPIGKERPDDIREAGSVTFLGGNMAMGILHARLYRLTFQDEYRKRAVRVADAMLKLVNQRGVYINDRDAWANGSFAGEWAREVLSLPGITSRHWTFLRNTAEAISSKARTTDGYYGGSWDGSPDGADSAWSRAHSLPQQIMTSANSANMIVAAGFLESPFPNNLRPILMMTRHPSTNGIELQVQSEKWQPCFIETSHDLLQWTPLKMFTGQGVPVPIPCFDKTIQQTRFYRASTLLTEW